MPRRRLPRSAPFALALILAASAGGVLAQNDDPDTADTPTSADTSGSYEVDGVDVDVTGPNADAARYGGWRLAQRRGWQLLSQRVGRGGGVPGDGTLDGIVTGIIIQNEQIGPNRYVARLGVLFSRERASAILGVELGGARSQPLLVLPIQYSGGAAVAFEQHTDWLDAWTNLRTSNSSVDYIRPTGTGPDSLLLTAGQIGRRSRGWWRIVLDQYGASDVLVPVVHLTRQWPDGPIIGRFEARRGPDNELLSAFTLRVGNADGLPALLAAGARRIDDIYQNAFTGGALSVDPSLAYRPAPVPTPTTSPTPTPTGTATSDTPPPIDVPSLSQSSVDVQVDTPTAAAVFAAESALRGVSGVRSAQTSSLAVGGVSVVHVVFDGDPVGLRAALESRGYTVQGSGSTLRIRRAGGAGGADTGPG